MQDLVPWPGTEPRPSALAVPSLNPWTQMLFIDFFNKHGESMLSGELTPVNRIQTWEGLEYRCVCWDTKHHRIFTCPHSHDDSLGHSGCYCSTSLYNNTLSSSVCYASQMAQWWGIYFPMQETEETCVPSLGWEDPWRRAWQPNPSILAWRIPWTEEPGWLWSIVSQSQTWLKRLSMHVHTC